MICIYIYLYYLVCLTIFMYVRLPININLDSKFWSLPDSVDISNAYLLGRVKHFKKSSTLPTLWPWPWPLTTPAETCCFTRTSSLLVFLYVGKYIPRIRHLVSLESSWLQGEGFFMKLEIETWVARGQKQVEFRSFFCICFSIGWVNYW